ncbi:hypothetical protein [Geopseudomonas aromaticivorans]
MSEVKGPDKGLMERLRIGANEIFDRFATALSNVEYKSAIGVPATVSAMVLCGGLCYEAFSRGELLDQGWTHYQAYKDVLANSTPSDLGEYLKAGLMNDLPSFGMNQVVQGVVAGYVTPVVGAVSVALARGYTHLKEWMGQQSPDPDAAREVVLNQQADLQRNQSASLGS